MLLQRLTWNLSGLPATKKLVRTKPLAMKQCRISDVLAAASNEWTAAFVSKRNYLRAKM
jgi:hypothetical protein